MTALMGRNGSGKSTLLRIAAGRLRPAYGRVLFRGEYVARPTLAAMAEPPPPALLDGSRAAA